MDSKPRFAKPMLTKANQGYSFLQVVLFVCLELQATYQAVFQILDDIW